MFDLDAPKEHGGEGSGFGPMQLLLAALGGCNGIDIIGITHKQRQKPERLEITVSGKRVPEPPRVYEKVNVEYKIRGRHLKEKAVKRAIELSQEKYCSVVATLKTKAHVSFNYEIQQT
jgi:putative redox protein